MSQRTGSLVEVLRGASRGFEGRSVQGLARQALAAETFAQTAPDDAATNEAMACHVARVLDVAGTPSLDMQDVGAKLAALLHIRLSDCPCDFDEYQRAEVYLISSALADLVLLGGGSHLALPQDSGRPRPMLKEART